MDIVVPFVKVILIVGIAEDSPEVDVVEDVGVDVVVVVVEDGDDVDDVDDVDVGPVVEDVLIVVVVV